MVDLTELQKIKDKGTHRYWLWRENPNVESGRIMAWVMCNPSTSRRLLTDKPTLYLQKQGNRTVKCCTTEKDDDTIRDIQDFIFKQSFCGHAYKDLFVVNLYPYRSPKSKYLRPSTGCHLGYGDTEQENALELVFKYSDDLFFAWGPDAPAKAGKDNFKKAKVQVRDLAKSVKHKLTRCAKHKKYFYLKKTGYGHPKHPGRGFLKNKKLGSKIFQEKLCELKI